eukprot:TRINITY_DN8871_c0_g1_i5.p1 TRINITY_DN8871_c0_g1~~TRINITY_DN8871_c0_g1_i5.p1  ORF type:complete len:361 (+),score=87.29 TRINITY_DN8871_c0_g1_i5:630-1712(+)
MNIVTAVLLLFLPEEHAFYVLCSIVELLVPEFYGKQMIGLIVDQRIFDELLTDKFPEVPKHFEETGLPLTTVTGAWFLCLFVGHVPLEVAFRILDCFFYEGSNILLSFGISLMEMNLASVLQCDGVEVYDILKSYNWEFPFFERAFSAAMPTASKLDEMRASNTFSAIKELEERGKKSRLREFTKTTHFSRPELDKVFQRYTTVTPNDHLNYEEFEQVFKGDVPWWNQDPLEVFKLLDVQRMGVVYFSEYISALSVILKGSPQEQLTFCFALYDGDNDNNISMAEYEMARNLMYTFALKRREVVASVFQNSDASKTNRLTLDEFKVAMETPILTLQDEPLLPFASLLNMAPPSSPREEGQ